MKSKKNTLTIKSNVENNVVQIDTKKATKMIIFSNLNEFTEKNGFRIDDKTLKIENKLQKKH